MTPTRRILTQNDVHLFQESPTYSELTQFIENLSLAVQGLENNADCEVSENVEVILSALGHVQTTISHHPVIQDANTSRFGKIEFRDFYDEIVESSSKWIPYPEETTAYFNESWGNRTRIDYGSGHELNFICFLFILFKKEFVVKNDFTALVLKVFIKYLAVMRDLEKLYWLEPAGSHGVWGLDDYHFLPFLFGASQLATHRHLRPKSIHNSETVEMFAERYMYFGCIDFINKVKTVATLRWHSPMLDDISAVKTWSKVAEGMVKMYKAEVLGKLPIMQHFLFGNVIQAPEGMSESHEHSSEEDDHCVHNTWGDCCGIKVPSAIAATEMNKRIPFD